MFTQYNEKADYAKYIKLESGEKARLVSWKDLSCIQKLALNANYQVVKYPTWLVIFFMISLSFVVIATVIVIIKEFYETKKEWNSINDRNEQLLFLVITVALFLTFILVIVISVFTIYAIYLVNRKDKMTDLVKSGLQKDENHPLTGMV
jgi:hypothetical protein